jgi:thymidylate synthase (FAD)
MTRPTAELVTHHAHDQMVANAARVTKSKHRHFRWNVLRLLADDERLIKYMIKHRHGTPFEHNYFQFRISVPIFAQRDWMRHRVGHSFNEISTRWQEMDALGVYEPDCLRFQVGKPHEYEYVDVSEEGASWHYRLWHHYRLWYLIRAQRQGVKRYRKMLDRGYAREQAMAALPMGTYTEFVWSCNARSLMHFLGLRRQPNVRKEIRQVCEQLESHFQAAMPVTYAAWVENGYVAP